jgi:hypothetical protein
MMRPHASTMTIAAAPLSSSAIGLWWISRHKIIDQTLSSFAPLLILRHWHCDIPRACRQVHRKRMPCVQRNESNDDHPLRFVLS